MISHVTLLLGVEIMKGKNVRLEDAFETDSVFETLEAYKVRFLLLVFLVTGFVLHLLVTEATVHRVFGFPIEFYGKVADAIIIAAVIGITYEWYAKKERKRQLKQVFHNTLDDISHDSSISHTELKIALSQILSSDDVAMFAVFQREDGTQLVQNKIKRADESVRIIGGFRASTGKKIDESSTEYHEAKKERLQADSEVYFCHLYSNEEMTREWLDSHVQLLKASEGQASQYEIHHLDSHPPHISFIIIDGEYVIIDLKDDRNPHGVKDTELVLGTSHEEVVNLFLTYFEFSYDSEKAINSADELKSAL